MEYPRLDPPFVLPPPAVGLARVGYQILDVASRLFPGRLRRRWGWWRWNEVLGSHSMYGETLTHGRYQDQLPVVQLLRRGFQPPSGITPWPKVFSDLHNTWNSDNYWNKVSSHELCAWCSIWKSHPKGQECLDMALVGCAQAGRVDICKELLAAGANPQASPKHGGRLMDKLWGRPDRPFSHRLNVWREVVAACPTMADTATWQSWSSRASFVVALTASDLEFWRHSGTPMPTPPAALLFAREWADDVSLGDHSPHMKEGQGALCWWQASGLLPRRAATDLLKTWLSTSRAGNEDYYQAAMEQWAKIFLPGDLPPRPTQGPGVRNGRGYESKEGPLPWSHWAMSGPFFENIPLSALEKLFSEPDSWTARNSKGEDIRMVMERRIAETHSQSRDEGLAKLRRFMNRAQLQDSVRGRIETPQPVARPRM